MSDFLDTLQPAVAHQDAPPKPCLKRIDHVDAAPAVSVTWCTLEDGHQGQCSGPVPRVIELDDLGPDYTKRRRG